MLTNLFFAVLGAVISVVFAVLYSKYEIGQFREKDKKGLRRKLVKAFQFNIKRLTQMSGQLSKGITPDYRLDAESVSHVLFHGRDLFDDEKWFDDFNWQRFQLMHINAKVDFINLSSSGNQPTAANAVAQQRFPSLIQHLQITHKEISDLLARYEKEA